MLIINPYLRALFGPIVQPSLLTICVYLRSSAAILTYVALIALSTLSCSPAAEGPGSPQPNIILITLDTTRPDRLGCYGYEKPISPNLDRLAEESVVHLNALSTSSWTLPAHASLFTGRFPSSHGARYDSEGPFMLTSAIEGPELWKKYRARGIGETQPTLAEILARDGYRTGAIVGGPWMKAIFGLDRGFNHYDDSQISSVAGRLAQDISTAAVGWIQAHKDDPFFLFLNYYDPHSPYEPPQRFVERYVPRELRQDGSSEAELKNALYDAEIAYMDDQIGVVLASLEKYGIDEKTWIIVTADHGELLGEHELWGHGLALTEHELCIPLIVRWPFGERTPGVSAERIQILDIFAMILNRMGIELPEETQASSPDLVTHPILAEFFPLPRRPPSGNWRAIYEDDLKLLWNSEGRHLMFDLATDPGEQRDLYPTRQDDGARLERVLLKYVRTLPLPPAQDGEDVHLDEETLKALRSLGYTN